MTRREFMFSITAVAVAGISTADAVKTIRGKTVKKAIKTAIVNHLYEDATPEEVEKEWYIVPGTFKNFIENFQKVNWKDIFIFI